MAGGRAQGAAHSSDLQASQDFTQQALQAGGSAPRQGQRAAAETPRRPARGAVRAAWGGGLSVPGPRVPRSLSGCCGGALCASPLQALKPTTPHACAAALSGLQGLSSPRCWDGGEETEGKYPEASTGQRKRSEGDRNGREARSEFRTKVSEGDRFRRPILGKANQAED